MKIDANDLPVPEFVDPGTVRVGQWAFATGRTFAADEPTVHIGIVSAKRRQFGRALQIDAYTSPANYGGAVIDVEGNVLGVAVPLSPTGRPWRRAIDTAQESPDDIVPLARAFLRRAAERSCGTPPELSASACARSGRSATTSACAGRRASTTRC